MAASFLNIDSSRTSDNNVDYNNSSRIQFMEKSSQTYSPVTSSIGTGYYSSHPISLSSLFGGQSWIKNRHSGTSMSHEVSGARGYDGGYELMAEENELRLNGMEVTSTATTQMIINEDITSGKAHIGVLQGSAPDHVSLNRVPSSTAWKDPALEIDEDYIGTFHIEKNMTLELSYEQIRKMEEWLNCCGGYFDPSGKVKGHISAESVFDHRFII
jgi:hypothetical protein